VQEFIELLILAQYGLYSRAYSVAEVKWSFLTLHNKAKKKLYGAD